MDRNDRVILTTIVDKFDGGPVGIETLAASIGEDSGTLEDVYEPYLIQNGYINRTPRGRVATKAAYDNLGRPFKQNNINILKNVFYELNSKCIYYILNMFISTYMEGTYVIKEYSRSNSWR